MTAKFHTFTLFPLPSGKGRQSLRLLPMSALESGEVKNSVTKVADTEGSSFIYTVCVCVHAK